MKAEETKILIQTPISLKEDFQNACESSGKSMSEEIRLFMARKIRNANKKKNR